MAYSVHCANSSSREISKASPQDLTIRVCWVVTDKYRFARRPWPCRLSVCNKRQIVRHTSQRAAGKRRSILLARAFQSVARSLRCRCPKGQHLGVARRMGLPQLCVLERDTISDFIRPSLESVESMGIRISRARPPLWAISLSKTLFSCGL